MGKVEQMVRIKQGEHLSPFCYPESVAIKRIEKIGAWMSRNLDWELVPVTEYDPATVWKDNHPVFDPFISDQLIMLGKLEDSWLP